MGSAIPHHRTLGSSALVEREGICSTELAEWITTWAPAISADQILDLATVGINALLGARFSATVLQDADNHIPDQRYLTEWTATLSGRIQALIPPEE
ncbi:MAG: hypothetical protein K0U84_14350 [Actinomycetia bacterium]|nr:hypothetical protein [Actinomycetes bacterium]